MSRFDRLMQENISIRRLTGISSTGGKTYDPARAEDPAVIKGRMEWQRRKVLNDKGEEALSEAVVYTPTKLGTGDLVIIDSKEWPVKSVSEKKGLYGGTDHWEVRL